MAADPDHAEFVIPDNDFFGLGPAEYAGEVYQQGLVKAEGIKGLYASPPPEPGQAAQVSLRAPRSGRDPIRREPCTFVRADFRADGSPWPKDVGRVQPWLVCHICAQQFSPASLLIHEAQCLAKYNARKRKIDPTPRRPRVTVDPPMTVAAYNKRAMAAYNETALSRCPICGKTFSNDKIVKHTATCTDFVDGQDPVAEMMSQAVEDGVSEADAVANAMAIWRKTHPPPSAASDAEKQRAAAAEGGAAAVNELLFREWLNELRGYSECYHETEQDESLGQAQARHLEYVQYASTVGEHLEGAAIKQALEKRHAVDGTDGKRQRVLRRRVKQIEQIEELKDRGVKLSDLQEAKLAQASRLRKELEFLTRPTPAERDWDLRTAARPNQRKPWRPETAPLCVGGNAWSGQYYDPHEHGTRAQRPLSTPSFSGVVRNAWPPQTAGHADGDSSSSMPRPEGDEAPVGGEDEQAVQIEDPYLEAKFPKRPEAKRTPGDGRARTRARVSKVPTDYWAASSRCPTCLKTIRNDKFAQHCAGCNQPGTGLGACLVTKPLSRELQLEAAFETIDTRATGGRMDAAGLQKLMAEAGLPIGEAAAKMMIEEANVGQDARGLTIDEFVRQLKLA